MIITTSSLITAAIYTLTRAVPQYLEEKKNKKTQEFNNRPRKLRILGFPNSGKTQFLNALRNIPNPPSKVQTIGKGGVIDIPLFNFISNDGTLSREISAKDINGSHEFLVLNAKSFILEADYLLFCCDIIKYLQNVDEYRNKANQVMRVISDYIKDNKFARVRIILTYEDQLPSIGLSPKKAMDDFKKIIENAPYGKFTCCTVNTSNQSQVRKLFSEIVYGK